MKLAVDIDGVLSNFCDAFAKILTDQTGMAFPKTSVDWPECWDWDRAAGVTPEQETAAWKTVWGDAEFWLNLRMFPETQLVATQLNYLSKIGHEVVFITNRAGERAKNQTERWLYGIGIDYPTVLLAANKIPLIRLLGIDFFIDDNLDTVNEVARVAEEEKLPVYGHVYLKAAAYNRTGRRGDLKVVDGVLEALRLEGLWK